MASSKMPFVVIAFAFIVGIAFTLAVWFGMAYLLWWVVAGFGHELPFWPTVGAVVFTFLFLGLSSRAVRR